jgi:putative ABC transport system permease protein
LILLLACVNFMNLSTARSARRAREVGVRKALGSQRSQLVGQFLGETLVFSVVAMAGAAVLARLALPGFNTLTGLEKQSADLFAMPLALYVAALPLLTTLLGGLYPAFFLSRFKASEVIKSRSLTAQSGHGRLRSALVVFQFAVSVALMLGTFVVMRQVGFARQASPGMQREHVLYLDNVRLFPSASARETFRQQLLQMPEVEQATHASFLPSIGSFGDFYEPEQGGQSNAVVNSLLLSSYLTDDGFVPALGMEMLAGRNFLPQSTVDSQSVILNESAVKAIGWQNPIGQWLRYPGNQNQRFQVVGVVRDFHIGSIRTAIEPVAIFYESSKTYRTWGSYLALRLKPGAAQSAIEKTAAMWATALPGAPFEYDFLDASFANLYRMEARTGAVLGVLTALAMLIGCLGLFALAAYTAEQRTKEIGVRKVLGATVLGVTTLLTRDFLKLVVLALCIGLPLAWYYTRTWLQGYAYRIEVAWWYFALAAVAALLIAVFTVSVQSVRAAMANPVDTLRGE